MYEAIPTEQYQKFVATMVKDLKNIPVEPPFFKERETVLDYLSLNHKIENVLEIGTLAGDFAEEILNRISPKQLDLIDTFNWDDWEHSGNKQRFLKEDHFAFVSNRFINKPVRIFKGLSHEVLRSMETKTYDFIYLDSDHTYECVSNELLEIDRFCKIGTVIGFDDYNVRQVQAAVTQWLSRNPKWKVLYLAFGQHGMTNLFIEKINT